MASAVVRLGIGACLLAMTAGAHAATPITLPFGDLGLQMDASIELPVPPAPQVARPDIPAMRLVIKQQPRACSPHALRRPAGERRQVAAGSAPDRPVKPSRWG